MADSHDLQRIFDQAVGLSASDRQAFLDQACRHDSRVRATVDRLLDAHDRAGSFLDTQAGPSENVPRSLATGQRFGPYEIVEPIGAGGMGEVFKARDTRLNRTVAIKVLPAHFVDDPDAGERFEREAHAVATLNHPHICTLHDVGNQRGVAFLVMEYLDGETLASRLERGRLRVDQALQYAIQIASALDRVHRAGIVHRDLKPGNIMLTKDGVKLLDFGLSKAHQSTVVGDAAITQPIAPDLTSVGTILGTMQYMAPEQLEGKRADARTDIFAFGAVLYEMLAGRKAFPGITSENIRSAIRDDEPAPIPGIPAAIDRLIRCCLAKDPDDRWQTARDLLRQLTWLADATIDGDASTRRRSFSWTGWAMAAVALAATLALAVVSYLYVNRAVSEPLPARFEVLTPPTSDPTSFALSPDGRQLAYVGAADGSSKLWVRPLDQTASRALDGTEGATYPFWAPDGRTIAFFAGGKLKRMDIAGTGPRVIADAPNGRGGSWNRQGMIVFAPSTATTIMLVDATGGTPAPVTRLAAGQRTHRWPTFLPDGIRFLFVSSYGQPGTDGVFMAAIGGDSTTRILDADSPAVYAPPGRLVYERDGALVSVAFDPNRSVTTGDPALVAKPIGVDTAIRSAFSISESGVLAHRAGVAAQRQLTWVDRSGAVVGSLGPSDGDAIAAPELTRDGRGVAVYRSVEGNADIWTIPVATGVPTRATFGTGIEALPVWCPDGRRVVFTAKHKDAWSLLARSADGGDDQPLFGTSQLRIALDCSPDGRFLMYSVQVPQTGVDLWTVPLPLGGDDKASPVAQMPFDEMAGQFSPDGKWIAYQANATGRLEVYVRMFVAQGGQQQISPAGGSQPRWSADGKELFYIAADGSMMAAPLRIDAAGGTIESSRPQRLFQTHLATGANVLPAVGSRAQYAVAPDGRFLLNEAIEGAPAPPITVTLNWQAVAAGK